MAPTTTDFDATCPWCSRANQAHVAAQAVTPNPGDVSVCWDCARPAIYRQTPAGLALRVPTPAEMEDLGSEVWEAVAAVRRARREGRRPSETAATLGRSES